MNSLSLTSRAGVLACGEDRSGIFIVITITSTSFNVVRVQFPLSIALVVDWTSSIECEIPIWLG